MVILLYPKITEIANEFFVTLAISAGLWYNGVNHNYRGGKAMELGAKLKQARLEAGLSQRQLCGDVITRNMLSQIENGAARPSMDTLRYLAGRLGRNISYFLEEEAQISPKERQLQAVLETLAQAEQAIREGRSLYAGELLENLELGEDLYCAEMLNRKRLLLLGRAVPHRRQEICGELPSLDGELLLRAGAALDRGDPDRGAALLDSAEDRGSGEWNFLRGEVYLAQGEFSLAARCYHRAEAEYPEKTAPRLERCYRELGDYKLAYEYACRQR